MIVCLCHRISEQTLSKLIIDGACDLESVQKQCGAGTSCGSCVKIIHSYLKILGEPNHEQERRQKRNHRLVKRSVVR